MKTLLLALALAMSATCYGQSINQPNSSEDQAKEALPTPEDSTDTLSSDSAKTPENISTSQKPSETAKAPAEETPEQVLQRLIQECEGEKTESCLILTRGYMEEDNPVEAMKYAQRGCELNSSLACGVVGIITVTSEGNPKDNLAKASEYFEKGCRLGDPTSCKTLADIYKTGMLGEVSKDKIIELYRRSCDIGLAAGCKSLEQYEEANQQPGNPNP